MNASAVIGALGVPVRICPPGLDLIDEDYVKRLRGASVGESTCASSELRWYKGRIVVDWYPRISRWECAFTNVLHECIHAVLGPDSLQDGESALMAMTEALIRCVTNEDEAMRLRKDFSVYGFEWHDDEHEDEGEIGMDGACFQSEEWKEDVLVAGLEAGVVQYRRGVVVPVFGLGPHEAWGSWIAERRKTVRERHRMFRSFLAKPRLPNEHMLEVIQVLEHVR